MRFGVREICDVVLRAKSAQKIGNKVFYKGEPVLYFDSLKTSSVESATITVYAQGGRGNARLIAWEGERTVTFNMEDALLSKEGFAILSGAGITEASAEQRGSIKVHKTEVTNEVKEKTYQGKNYIEIKIKDKPYVGENRRPHPTIPNNYLEDDKEDFIYIMKLDDNGEIISEPYIAAESSTTIIQDGNMWKIQIYEIESLILLSDSKENPDNPNTRLAYRRNNINIFDNNCSVLVDYYTEKTTSDTYQIDITPDSFSGNFYLEASTLFRGTNGIDMPAQFIIPNCKIQSNFTFTMASSGDPSTFNFVIDAFPDYTRWNKNKKVFAAIQVIENNDIVSNFERLGTPHNYKSDEDYNPFLTYKREQEQYLADEPEEFLNMLFDSFGTNGEIYNNGKGYKKDCVLVFKQSAGYIQMQEIDQVIENEINPEGFLLTGYIPYKYGQNIHIVGLRAENSDDNRIDQNIELQKIYFYKNKSLSEVPQYEEGSFLLEHCQINNEVIFNPKNYEEEDILPNLDISEIEDANYIRICFYNTNLSEMAVLVSGNPISPEEESNNNLQSLSSLPNLNLQSNNDEEESISPEEEVSNLVDENLDISDIISLLKEEEEEE